MPSRRLDRRQGFLISATVHLIILTLLANAPERTVVQEVAPTPSEDPPPPRRVRLVPPRLAERLLRQQPSPPPAQPRPGKDRISVGPPSALRAERLDLKRDEELTNRPSGPPGPPKAGPPSPPPQVAEARPPVSALPPGNPGVFGPGLATAPRGDSGGPGERSIGRSLRDLDRRLGQMGPGVVEGGAGRQMGPLFFDPEGADFTGWVNHFKNEVYRNWIVPEAARFGFRAGHVDFEFWVERDGRMTGLRLLKSSGTPALDRAAQNALTGSRLLPLPSDFGPPRTRMQVTFYYNEASQG
jgi:protein TonB